MPPLVLPNLALAVLCWLSWGVLCERRRALAVDAPELLEGVSGRLLALASSTDRPTVLFIVMLYVVTPVGYAFSPPILLPASMALNAVLALLTLFGHMALPRRR